MDLTNNMNSTAVSDTVEGTNGMTFTLIILCQLYTLLQQWMSEDSTGSTSTLNHDTGINTDSNKGFIFSDVDCREYHPLIKYGYGQSANGTDVYDYDRDPYGVPDFFLCFLFFFMKEMGATENCYNMYVKYDSNTTDETPVTFLSKDRIIYSFMTDAFGLNDVCEQKAPVINISGVKKRILTITICDHIYAWTILLNAENTCTSETNSLSNQTWLSYYVCIWYRLLEETGVTNVCTMLYKHLAREMENQQAGCDLYNYIVPGIVGGVLSIIGIVCNVTSLIVFCRGVVQTPTIYQLQWLALVDTIFLTLYFVYVAMYYIIKYLNIDHDNLYWREIWPYLNVSIWPLLSTTSTGTNWLMVFIGVYRYLAICKPVSNSYSHVEQHRRKYVVIVLGMAALCNLPHFFAFKLSQDGRTKLYLTSFGKNNLFKSVYYKTTYPVLTVCLPVIILLVLTITMMVVLRKKQRESRTTQKQMIHKTTLIQLLSLFFLHHLPVPSTG